MKTSIRLEPGTNVPAHTIWPWGLAFGVMVLLGLNAGMASGQAPPPDKDVPGAQVLTRGPVHEAFAGVVAYNPAPGVVTTKAPPAPIEEMPPEEKPEGDNVTWIPGYWGWDDERSDFLWVSGTWRALPPGRQWMAGYWAKNAQGHQWTSGYWADAAVREATYLPPPPATVEVGPNIAAPSPDYAWTPGCWIWYQQRYAWRPGYWVQGRADWDWTPAHYVWTPRGYICVGGFWDYPVERRGVLFAPVYFEPAVYVQHGYYYSPTIAIDLGVFSDHLFLRPYYHHYYFGDYYAPSYFSGGFYASFSFQSGRHGYDPIYSHHRWQHRGDRDWEHHAAASYQHRRDHEDARPPRTWTAQKSIDPRTADARQNRVIVAAPIDQLAKRKDSPVKFQAVAKDERQRMVQRGQEVQKYREERQTLEAKSMATTPGKAGAVVEPARVQLPRSPIVAKPVSQMGKGQAPPQAPRAPKADTALPPKAGPTERQPGVERGKPSAPPRNPNPERKSAPDRIEPVPRERQAQPETPSNKKESAPRPEKEPPRSPTALERRSSPELERRPQGGSPRSTQFRPSPGEKGAAKLMDRAAKKEGDQR